MRRYLSAFAFLCLVALHVQAQAQTPATRSSLETQNNVAIFSNGTGAITGPVLNGLLGNYAASMATQLDSNTFTQQQTFLLPPVFQSLTGYVYCNGTSQCSASTSIIPSAIPLQVGTTTISNGAFNGIFYNNGGILGSLTATTNGVLCTSNTGLPSICAALPPISGGTGISSPSLYSILIGNNTGPMTQLAPSATSGIPLVSQGASANPAYSTAAVAGGGTGCTAASGTCLDNITAFSSTGFLTRTGAGTYAFQSATNGVTNSNLAQAGAATLKGNPTGSTANVQDFTIQNLTNLAAPNATLDYIPIYNHLTGTIQNATTNEIISSATAGVVSLNALTGALSIAAGNGVTVGAAGSTVTVAKDYSTDAVRIRQTVTSGPLQNAGSVTITIATPGVVTFTGSNLAVGTPIVLATTNALPTGLTAGTTYYVSTAGLTVNSFSLSTTLANAFAGTNITTSGSQSGMQTITAYESVPTFLPYTSASLSLTTQNLSSSFPLCQTAANGYSPSPYGEQNYTACTTSNLTWSSLAASSTVYLYDTLACSAGACTITTGSTTLAPIYQCGGQPSVTSGQFTFDYCAYVGYMGNGSTAAQAYDVFVGQAVTGASTVTSTAAYVYNGAYDSGLITPLPSTGVAISKPANIGSPNCLPLIRIQNLTAELGYSVGDVVQQPYTDASSSYTTPFSPWSTSLNVGFITGSYGAWVVNNKTSGGVGSATLGNWSYGLTCKRFF